MRTDFSIMQVPNSAIIGYETFKPIFMYRVFKDGKRIHTFEFCKPLQSKNQLKRIMSANNSRPLPF